MVLVQCFVCVGDFFIFQWCIMVVSCFSFGWSIKINCGLVRNQYWFVVLMGFGQGLVNCVYVVVIDMCCCLVCSFELFENIS